MGVYLSRAKTDKESECGGDSEKNGTRFGLTSMQGWRQSMEDAHIALPSVEELNQTLNREIGLYGVFDGHGGPSVSAWIAKHIIPTLTQELKRAQDALPSEAQLDGLPRDVAVICEALQKSFLQLDVDMQTSDNDEELVRIHASAMDKSDADTENGDDRDGASSLRGLLTGNSRNYFQAFLGAAGGMRPVIKLVEQDGEQFYQISNAPEEEEEEEMQNSQQDNNESHNNAEESNSVNPSDNATQKPLGEDSLSIAEESEQPTQAADTTSSSSPAQKLHAEGLISPSEEKSSSSAQAKDDDHTQPPVAATDNEDAAHEDEQQQSKTDNATPNPLLHNGGEDDEETIQTGEDQPKGMDNNNAPEGDQSRKGVIAESCGAAVVVSVIMEGDPPYLITANAGDSRCVLCRGGIALAQSYDHKPMLESERLRINKAGGIIQNGRVDGNLNLSRTLGDLYYKRNQGLKPEEQKITAFPDVRVMPICPDDEFVILACDGIWDCVTNQGACEFVRSKLGDNPTPEHLSKICEMLCDECLAASPQESEGGIGCDNMTCIIVLLNKKFTQRGAVGSATSRLYERPLC